VLRKDGTRSMIAPHELTDGYEENPIISLQTLRADFNGALLQFLIGLYQVALGSNSEIVWSRYFRNPPSPKIIKDSFLPYISAFSLFGPGPKFMQDHEKIEGEKLGIEKMILDAPGEQTITRNTDLFVKRNGIGGLCYSCCATALFTLQTNAPSGGSGHRTSLRGGGPLTTLALGSTLWETVWLNVIPHSYMDVAVKVEQQAALLSLVFPWIAPTRTSEKNTGTKTQPQDAHPYQAYWGMPRRIMLCNEGKIGTCSICGEKDMPLVTHYIQKTYGIDYGDGWRHPLSPYAVNEDGSRISIHTSPRGITYRHWLRYTYGDTNNKTRYEPALSIYTFLARSGRMGREFDVLGEKRRFFSFGYDFDNMKARCWYEGEMPLIYVEENIRPAYLSATTALIRTAEYVISLTSANVRKALGLDKISSLSFIDADFWVRTESSFYSTLDAIAHVVHDAKEIDTKKLEWFSILRATALDIFDKKSQASMMGQIDPGNVATAYLTLARSLTPKAKKVSKLLELSQEPRIEG